MKELNSNLQPLDSEDTCLHILSFIFYPKSFKTMLVLAYVNRNFYKAIQFLFHQYYGSQYCFALKNELEYKTSHIDFAEPFIFPLVLEDGSSLKIKFIPDDTKKKKWVKIWNRYDKFIFTQEIRDLSSENPYALMVQIYASSIATGLNVLVCFSGQAWFTNDFRFKKFVKLRHQYHSICCAAFINNRYFLIDQRDNNFILISAKEEIKIPEKSRHFFALGKHLFIYLVSGVVIYYKLDTKNRLSKVGEFKVNSQEMFDFKQINETEIIFTGTSPDSNFVFQHWSWVNNNLKIEKKNTSIPFRTDFCINKYKIALISTLIPLESQSNSHGKKLIVVNTCTGIIINQFTIQLEEIFNSYFSKDFQVTALNFPHPKKGLQHLFFKNADSIGLFLKGATQFKHIFLSLKISFNKLKPLSFLNKDLNSDSEKKNLPAPGT